jgi:hypothetical protein
MEQVKTKSVKLHQRSTLPEVSWDDATSQEPTWNADRGIFTECPRRRSPPGGSPIIHKESSGASRPVQVSRNPFVTTL